jgi:hypothetical protein
MILATNRPSDHAFIPSLTRLAARCARLRTRRLVGHGYRRACLRYHQLHRREILPPTDGENTQATREKFSERSIRMALPLAFLRPAIVKAAIDGTLPFGTGVMALAELPIDWEQQGSVVASAGSIDPRRCAS